MPRRRRHGARMVFLATAGVLSLLIAAGAGFAVATIRQVEQGIRKIEVDRGCSGPDCLEDVDPICIREACTFLVLGSDSRAGVPKRLANPATGQRSDTIIVVQVDVQRDRTVVLSIPRDLRVHIPGHGMNKINTALNYGPNLIVKTVERVTGLHINHYVEVNFLGFERLVDALGGIPMCINRPLKDKLADLNLPRAGCYKLNGRQALAFVRARHIEGDLIPDFSRISRQQQFMRAVIEKGLSIGSVLRLPDLIRAVENNLVVDENMDIYGLQDLTKRLGVLGQRRVAFRIVPSVPVRLNGVDYLKLLEPQASRLFDRMRKGKSLGNLGKEASLTPLSPANVTVQVLDSSSGGAAQEVAAYLRKAGFLVSPVKPAPSDLTSSAILWGHDQDKLKDVVSAYLTSLDVVHDNSHTSGSVVVVVVASDFPGIPGA